MIISKLNFLKIKKYYFLIFLNKNYFLKNILLNAFSCRNELLNEFTRHDRKILILRNKQKINQVGQNRLDSHG